MQLERPRKDVQVPESTSKEFYGRLEDLQKDCCGEYAPRNFWQSLKHDFNCCEIQKLLVATELLPDDSLTIGS